VSGNNAVNNTYGIVLRNSTDNTLSGNTTSYNTLGIQVFGTNSLYSDGLFSRYNTLRDNTISYNDPYGLVLGLDSSDSTIFNNNFIENYAQISVAAGSTGNVFNLDKPIGGNYWSDWTSPDADHDGFVDSPYVFANGQDDLPWADPDGWGCRDPRETIAELASQVESLNLQHGISNSLDAKLAAALQALEDINENNDLAAINTLEAFISAVQAQSDNKIPQADADALIARAQKIVDCLRGS
jgi:parallel beta-helix repeat protein